MSFRECLIDRPMVPNEPVKRELTHEQLQEHVDAYLARGGTITEVSSDYRAKPQDSVRDFKINLKKEAQRLPNNQYNEQQETA